MGPGFPAATYSARIGEGPDGAIGLTFVGVPRFFLCMCSEGVEYRYKSIVFGTANTAFIVHEHDIFSACCIPSKISAPHLAPIS